MFARNCIYPLEKCAKYNYHFICFWARWAKNESHKNCWRLSTKHTKANWIRCSIECAPVTWTLKVTLILKAFAYITIVGVLCVCACIQTRAINFVSLQLIKLIIYSHHVRPARTEKKHEIYYRFKKKLCWFLLKKNEFFFSSNLTQRWFSIYDMYKK